jgi:glutathione S-transferase
MTTKLTLVSHPLCPYVQRAAVALSEKGVPFERIVVDLGAKPDWFKVISPLGKVPLLRVRENDGEHVIFESAVILEYLEETQPRPLHPAEPVARARHRSWIEFGSAVLNGIGRFYSAGTEAGFLAEAQALSSMFDRVERELATRAASGPWFSGENFSLVDAAFGPVFRYFDTFDRIGDFGILGDKPQVAAWREQLAGRPSIAAAVGADYPTRLLAFLKARNSQLAELIRAKAPATIPVSVEAA